MTRAILLPRRGQEVFIALGPVNLRLVKRAEAGERFTKG